MRTWNEVVSIRCLASVMQSRRVLARFASILSRFLRAHHAYTEPICRANLSYLLHRFRACDRAKLQVCINTLLVAYIPTTCKLLPSRRDRRAKSSCPWLDPWDGVRQATGSSQLRAANGSVVETVSFFFAEPHQAN